MTDREQMLQMWLDMSGDGNWVPSWTDSLADLSVEDATWTPVPNAHCIWQEVVHVTFWRNVTLAKLQGRSSPSGDEVERMEFALPDDRSEESWKAALQAFSEAHSAIADAIRDEEADVSRVPYHLIHDAYHLGRITHLRSMLGTAPKF